MEIKVTYGDNLKVNAYVNGHTVYTDQPVRSGGDDDAPAPFDLFLVSIATCAGIYVKSFCKSRDIDTSKITIIQRHSYNPEKRLIDHIEIEVNLPADFPEKYKPMIQNVIDQCAVKKHIMNPPVFSIKV